MTSFRKYYNFRSVCIEALEWSKLTTSEGQLVENENLDDTKLDIMETTTDQ